MKKINLLLLFMLVIISVCSARNVDNYWDQPGRDGDNTLNITGTQVVTGTMTITGTLDASASTSSYGLITASSATVTNTITGGSVTDGVATLTAGAITGLLDFTSSSGTVTNLFTCGTIDTGQGATEVYAMDQDVQTTDDVTFSSGTVTNTLTANVVQYGVVLSTGSAPAAAGIIGIDSSFDVYVSTGTGAGEWVLIGSQS